MRQTDPPAQLVSPRARRQAAGMQEVGAEKSCALELFQLCLTSTSLHASHGQQGLHHTSPMMLQQGEWGEPGPLAALPWYRAARQKLERGQRVQSCVCSPQLQSIQEPGCRVCRSHVNQKQPQTGPSLGQGQFLVSSCWGAGPAMAACPTWAEAVPLPWPRLAGVHVRCTGVCCAGLPARCPAQPQASSAVASMPA